MNLKHIASFSIEDCVDFSENHENLWRKVTFRQEHIMSPHKNTEAIYIIWPLEFSVEAALRSTESVVHDFTDDKVFELYLFLLLAKIQQTVGSKILRAVFVKLAPGGSISPHIDQGPFAEISERYHLVITSNSECFLSSGRETAQPAPGELWYFNKHVLHTATNGGTSPRINLIIDVAR